MEETLGRDEIAFLHKFADKYSPDTSGKPLLSRIDDVNIKLQSLFIGVDQLVKHTKRHFPKVVEEA
jgi:hypothetical protein